MITTAPNLAIPARPQLSFFRSRFWMNRHCGSCSEAIAVRAVEQADLARIESDRKWRDVSVSTDFHADG